MNLSKAEKLSQMFVQKRSWVDLRDVTKFSIQLLEDWFTQNRIQVKEKSDEIC
jgi:hypothetical protein